MTTLGGLGDIHNMELWLEPVSMDTKVVSDVKWHVASISISDLSEGNR